jgi:hypothetical protein
MSERLVRERYLNVAARLEGLIEAHEILKGGEGDDADMLLWRLTKEVLAEEYGNE